MWSCLGFLWITIRALLGFQSEVAKELGDEFAYFGQCIYNTREERIVRDRG